MAESQHSPKFAEKRITARDVVRVIWKKGMWLITILVAFLFTIAFGSFEAHKIRSHQKFTTASFLRRTNSREWKIIEFSFYDKGSHYNGQVYKTYGCWMEGCNYIVVYDSLNPYRNLLLLEEPICGSDSLSQAEIDSIGHRHMDLVRWWNF
jgi:hypothetical protein